MLAFRLGKFITPKSGATVRASARSLAVRFNLLATIVGKGTSIASGIAKSLAKAASSWQA